MDAAELAIHRDQTVHFINDDPVSVVLTRHVTVRTDAGGTRTTSSPLPAQIFRLIPQSASEKAVETPDGQLASRAYDLLAAWDADVARGDTFTHDRVEYLVAGPVLPEASSNVYQRKAAVVRRG